MKPLYSDSGFHLGVSQDQWFVYTVKKWKDKHGNPQEQNVVVGYYSHLDAAARRFCELCSMDGASTLAEYIERFEDAANKLTRAVTPRALK